MFAIVATKRRSSPKVRERSLEVMNRLKVLYPQAICELTHEDAFQLLAATILSAQCTDARVNIVTPALFAEYPTAERLAVADPARVEEIVRSTGFYQTKAKNLIGMARGVVDRFGGLTLAALAHCPRLGGCALVDGRVAERGEQVEQRLGLRMQRHRPSLSAACRPSAAGVSRPRRVACAMIC